MPDGAAIAIGGAADAVRVAAEAEGVTVADAPVVATAEDGKSRSS